LSSESPKTERERETSGKEEKKGRSDNGFAMNLSCVLKKRERRGKKDAGKPVGQGKGEEKKKERGEKMTHIL